MIRPFENLTNVSNRWNVWISGVWYSDGYCSTDLGPHLQCSLKEIPKFLQNLKLQNNILKIYFSTFWFHVCYCNWGLALKTKNCNSYVIKLSVFHKRKFLKPMSKAYKWVLWIRLLGFWDQSWVVNSFWPQQEN